VTSLLGLLALAAPAAEAGSGGMYASEPPRPSSVTCSTACTGLDSAGPGSVIRISGEALDQVGTVVFLGDEGSDDDKAASALEPSPGSVGAVVPEGAVSGPVMVMNTDGNASAPTKARLTVTSGAELSAQSGGVEARVDARKVFYAGRRKARLSYFVRAGNQTTVRGELVRGRDGKVVLAFPAQTVPGRTVQTLEWDGTIGGRVPADGRYLWRVHVRAADSSSSAQAAQADPGETVVEQAFTFVRDRFPIRGKHSFGTGAGAYGAARGGGSHQGQDVFAKCGTPLVATRGGVVKFAGAQARAGNYIVIDAAGTGQDHIYMHLQDAVTFVKGDRVYTGQVIGAVGDTGVADGCHLHFELWSAPGWYSGGHAIDPNPSLRRWEKLG